MIAALILLVALSVPTFEQDPQTPNSPCPDVFEYEPPNSEYAGPAKRWYGNIKLSTDNTLYSIWLTIVLDKKADILGNWLGESITTDNIEYKIENTTLKVNPGPPTNIRFFVQYGSLSPVPRIKLIIMNGREICNADIPQPVFVGAEQDTNRPQLVQQPGTNEFSSIAPVIFGGSSSHDIDTRPVQGPTPNEFSSIAPTFSGGGSSQNFNRPVQRPSATEFSSITPNFIGGGSSQNVNNRPSLNQRPTQVDFSSIIPSIFGSTSSQNIDAMGLPLFGPATPTPIRGQTFRPTTSSNADDADYFNPHTYSLFDNPVPSAPRTTQRSSTLFQNQNPVQCGRVTKNNPNPLIVNGTPTLEGQWPWQIALYQTQGVDNKYLCGGTLVSDRHVITAAHCVTRKRSQLVVNQDTLTVYLGKHNLRTSITGVQIKFVVNIIVHPDYTPATFRGDLAILQLREPVAFTDWVRPACLWPDHLTDLQNVVGKTGAVVGWGFDETGVASEELSLAEMPVVDQETCLRSHDQFFVRFTSPFSYCAGYRQGASVCNGDSGGGMLFQSGGIWYLRGLVSLSVARLNEYRCDPNHYVIFTDVAKFLPWIKQIVYGF